MDCILKHSEQVSFKTCEGCLLWIKKKDKKKKKKKKKKTCDKVVVKLTLKEDTTGMYFRDIIFKDLQY